MKKILRAGAAVVLGLHLLLSSPATAQADELTILAGGALAEPLRELAAQFEQATGHSVIMQYGTTPELIRLATSGAPFDLGVCPEDVLKDSNARTQFASQPARRIAYAGLAMAVRPGAPRPDISTPAALKRTLLSTRALVTIPASATGTQLYQVFDALGIREAVQSKIVARSTPAQLGEAVLNGEADVAVFLLNVLMASGLDVVGPFPGALQREVMFTSALAAAAPHPQAAQAFVAFLKSPTGIEVFRKKGLQPAE